MDNGRFRIKDLIIAEFLSPVTLVEPKVVLHKQGDEDDLEFYTKSEMYQWLAANDYRQIAIFENGDGVWATPDKEWE